MPELTHAMNCGGYPGSDENCTCGLEWRIALQTEQTMHNAWRKRAEEAEAESERLKHKLDCRQKAEGEAHRLFHEPLGNALDIDWATLHGPDEDEPVAFVRILRGQLSKCRAGNGEYLQEIERLKGVCIELARDHAEEKMRLGTENKQLRNMLEKAGIE